MAAPAAAAGLLLRLRPLLLLEANVHKATQPSEEAWGEALPMGRANLQAKPQSAGLLDCLARVG